MKPPATALSVSLKAAFRDLFDNSLLLASTNFLWFVFSLLLPYWLFVNRQEKVSLLVFVFFCPLCSSLYYLHAAKIIYPDFPFTLKNVVKTFAVTFLSFVLILLFIFNSVFYGISILTRGISIVNSFFFFFSLCLACLVFGVIIFWVPLSIRENSLKSILVRGTLLYIGNLKKNIFPVVSYLSLSFLSFLIFFIMAMPVHSLLTFRIFEHLDKETLPSEKSSG
jgi:hypothetical protein